MEIKTKNTLEKIVTGIGLGIAVAIFSWMGYDTLKTKIEIEKEAKIRNETVYKICKEKGRSDVYEILEIEGSIKKRFPSEIYLF